MGRTGRKTIKGLTKDLADTKNSVVKARGKEEWVINGGR